MPARKRKSKTKPKIKSNYLTAALVIGGAVLVLIGGVKQYLVARTLQPNISEQVAVTGVVPVRLTVEGLIDLPLEKARLIGKRWQVDGDNGNYLAGSATLERAGNEIVYGHNRPQILGNLRKVGVGDKLWLFDERGESWPYRVVKTAVVSPNETKWLQETDTPVLTIYTCTGLLDSQRLIVRAIPTKE